jgi:hypothetical protein
MFRISPYTLVLALCLTSIGSVVAQGQSAEQQQPDSATIAAAIAELDNLHQELARRRQALEAGQQVEPDGERRFEDLVRLVQVLVRSEDPIVIRPLVSTMIGTPVIDAIAAFGELAVADVMAAAADPYADQIMALKTEVSQVTAEPIEAPADQHVKASVPRVLDEFVQGRRSLAPPLTPRSTYS